MLLDKTHKMFACDIFSTNKMEYIFIHKDDLKLFMNEQGYTLKQLENEYNSSHHVKLCNFIINGGAKKTFKILSEEL